MKPHRRVFVVGGAHTTFIGRGHPDFIWKRHPDFGTRKNPTLEEHLAAATRDALASTGVSAEAVEKAYVSNFLGECFSKQGHLGSMLAAVDPGLEGKPIVRVEAACASGAAAVAGCVDSIQAGVDVTLAVGAEVETNVPGRQGVEFMALAAHAEKQRHLEFALFPWLFARRAKAYKEAFGATNLDLGRVVAKAYGNASRNPLALKRTVQVTAEEAATVSGHNRPFLDDPELHDHIKLFDCTDFTDGASAVLLVSEEGLRRLGLQESDATELLAYGHTVRGLGKDTDPTRLANVAHAAAIAFADAGITPEEVDVAEVHDCFSITELQAIEALGLCGPGEAPRLLAAGDTAIEGRIPVNPGGGLLGFGHPIGATGVKQILELHRQLHGLCGDYQVPRSLRTGVAANLGGDDRTGIVTVLRRSA